MDIQKRYFRFKKNRCPRRVAWLTRDGIYQGELLSMTDRRVRLFAPAESDVPKKFDVSYDWLTPVRDPSPIPRGIESGNEVSP